MNEDIIKIEHYFKLIDNAEKQPFYQNDSLLYINVQDFKEEYEYASLNNIRCSRGKANNQIAIETIGCSEQRLCLFFGEDGFNKYGSKYLNKNYTFGVYFNKNKKYKFDCITQRLYLNETDITNENNILSNFIAYQNIVSIFQDCKKHDICIHDTASSIITFIQNVGKFEIGYSLKDVTLEFLEKNNIEKKLELIEDFLSKTETINFFKNEIYKTTRVVDKKLRLHYIIDNIENIIKCAEEDYRIYINNISFQEIIDKVYAEKEKYFSSLRETLQKIYSYSITMPISTGAALAGLVAIKSGQFPQLGIFLFLTLISFFIATFVHQNNLLKDVRNQRQEYENGRIRNEKISKLEIKEIDDCYKNITNKFASTQRMIYYNIAVTILITIGTFWAYFLIFDIRLLCILKLLKLL